MKYLKHYHLLMSKAKVRNDLNGYTEKHHIVPDFMFRERTRGGQSGHMEGNFNDPKNIVVLTAREHFIAHLLLAKGLKGTRYEYQSASALMFFFNIGNNKHPRSKVVDKCSSKTFEIARKLGILGISNSRKGTMPCVDTKTGLSVGAVSVSHPKVVSGEWVHHSKGKPGKGRCQQGSKNGNYKELTDDMRNHILTAVSVRCVFEGHLKANTVAGVVLDLYPHFKKISEVWIKNKFSNYSSLVEEMNRLLGTSIKYNPYYRFQDVKEKLSNSTKGKYWYNDGFKNKQFSEGEQPSEWRRGRLSDKNRSN